jgi:raffinose/stachyose/melibiose transport system substrate-binding protein
MVLPAFASMSRQIAQSEDIYMFCYAPSAYMFFYNKDIFADCGIEAAPTTWEEFLNVCQILTDKGYTAIATDDAYAARLLGVYLTYMKGSDYVADLVNGGLGEAWADEAVVAAVKEMEAMVQKGYYKPGQAANPYPTVQQEMVIEGQIAMYYNGTWLPNEVAVSAGENYRWGEFAFPVLPGAAYGQNYGGYASMGMNITTLSESPDACAAFMAYLTTSEYDSRYATECNGIPIGVEGVWNASLSDAKQVFEGYDSWFLSGSMIESNSELLPTLRDCCVRLLSGTMTADEFIAVMSGK